MSDCVIELQQQGELLVLAVRPAQGAPKRFSRPVLALSPQDMDALRGGEPEQQVIDRVTAQLSEWLVKPDPLTLEPELNLGDVLGLNSAAHPPCRLVFSTRELDNDNLLLKVMDLPVELLVPTRNGDPLVVHNRVAALVHFLRKTGQPPTNPDANSWPLRILIVRSNPDDLGGAVPKAAPLASHIRAQRPDLASHIVVDVLTSEATPGAAAGRPTRLQLLQQLEQAYDILVYLGHGNLRDAPEGQLPIGTLLLENDDASANDPVDAKKLSALLHTHPVPVVFLVGCLTAAELRAGITLDDLKPDIPRWMRGSQGVAQALINGQSGVQFVVGMRYRIESHDAIFFLEKFFTSLLRGTLANDQIDSTRIGDLESAVRQARSALLFARNQIGWAAPVILRTLGEEPTFRYLAFPPVGQIPEETQALRTLVWEGLKAVPWSSRPPQGNSPLHASILQMLQPIETKLMTDLRQRSAILMPERVELDPQRLNAAAPETTVAVPVLLHGPASVRTLQGTITEGSGIGRIAGVNAAPALAQQGFELFVAVVDAKTLKFQISNAGGNASPLPEGLLFTVPLTIGPAMQTVYTIRLQALAAVPALSVVGVSNAVIVPPV